MSRRASASDALGPTLAGAAPDIQATGEVARGPDWARFGSEAGTVVVLGNYRAALAAVREMSARGCVVVLGAEPDTFCAEHSRFVDEVWHCPPFVPRSQEFLAALRTLVRRLRPPVTVMPIRERSLDTVASFERELAAEVRLALPQARILAILHDKHRSLVAAQEAGLDVPAFAVADDWQQLRMQTATVGCPVVIRPIVAGSRLGAQKAVTIRDLAELDAAFSAFSDELPAMLIQRRFSGERMNVYFAARDGEMLAEQHVHCLRSDRFDGTGLTIDMMTIAPIASISRELRMLVKHLDYTGVGCAQFLYDAPRDKPCYLEINARFGASYALVEHVGMGLTGLAFDLAWNNRRGVRGASARYDAGTRLVWTLGDFSGLLHALRQRHVDGRQAVVWAGRALLSAARADLHAIWSLRDPLPALRLYARRIGHWLGLARRDVN